MFLISERPRYRRSRQLLCLHWLRADAFERYLPGYALPMSMSFSDASRRRRPRLNRLRTGAVTSKTRAALAAALLAAVSACSAGQTTDSGQSTTNPASRAPADATGSVWVADEGGNSLTVLDAATNTVSTTLTGMPGPHNVQVGHDGATVYASSNTTNTVVAIDAATYRVTATAPTGPEPAHVIEAPNGKVYVANSGDGTVSVYQSPNLQPVGLIDVGGMPHGLRAAAGGSVIVIANHMAGAVDLIDPRTDRMLGAVPVGDGPAQVAVTADGRYAYTGTTQPPAVVKVDLSARKVVGSVAVSASPVQLYLTPDEATVVSADQGTREAPGHAASLIDTTTMAVRAAVPTGAGPHGVVIDRAGTRAWVTDSYDNAVSVIDLASQTVAATVAVGVEPNGISYSTRRPAAGPATKALNIPAPPVAETQPPPAHHGHG